MDNNRFDKVTRENADSYAQHLINAYYKATDYMSKGNCFFAICDLVTADRDLEQPLLSNDKLRTQCENIITVG